MDTHASHHGNRVEDLRLVTGAGKYAADWSLPGQLYASFVRADRAHAEIVSVNTAKAARHPGVRRVYTGADALAAGYTKYFVIVNFPGRGGNHIIKPPRPVLAARKVRHVGDAVAMVVADSALAAQDAAELVEIEYRDLPAVVSAEAALAPGAPQLHEEAPGNLAFDFESGNEEAVKGAFAQAAHVTRLKLQISRVAPSPMELRGCTVRYDAGDGTYHVHVCIQGINMMRKQLAAITDVPEERIVVHAQDIGGSFGQRSAAYPEYCMQMLAAKELGRPVRWISTRSEGFMSDTHGRANTVSGELALDRDGKFLAMKLDWIADMGGYLSATGSASHTRNPSTCMTGVYRIPALYGRFRLAFTNYGAGRRLPRCWPSRRCVRDRAAGEPGRRGVEDRPGGAAETQFHPARGVSLQDAHRLDIRSDRSPRCAGAGAQVRRLERVCGAPPEVGTSGEAARPRHCHRHREYGSRVVPQGPGRDRSHPFRRDRCLYGVAVAGAGSRDDVRHDRSGGARSTARTGAHSAGREAALRQPHGRLALHRGRRQRVQARRAEADRAGALARRGEARSRALAGRIRRRRIPDARFENGKSACSNWPAEAGS